MSWTEVRVRTAGETTRDAVVAALVHAGAPAVLELDDALLTHLPADSDVSALEAALRAADATVTVESRDAGHIDVARAWPPAVGVHRVGRIAVAPPWRAAEVADAECPVIIEPAMAFGTGEHETTRGVLRLMQNVVQPGDRTIDVGAGSAILSIAAVKLGAARAIAIESDPQAIANAEENAVANGVADRVRVIEGDARVILPLVAPARVLFANIIASVVVELAPAMRAALSPNGRAVVSGILVDERPAVTASLARAGWCVESEFVEGEWWSSVIATR
ncbi:MAG TPA: 50S ribosomal protein L11 methyltransferase [Gemmatimonadaceae bacterium]|nr:50S ribosomal protein L11 methyltransferase [Gemmatimonadaceae bacterium]